MPWDELRHAKLENEHLLLRPIAAADREQFHAIAFDPEIWRFYVGRIDTEVEFDRFMNSALDDLAAGRRFPFAIVHKPSDKIAGTMSFGNLAEAEARIEIGWSWLGKDYRGKGVNRWAKYLLLEHAFESLGCERVEFKTDVLNLQARKGLSNIGAKEEGVLRSFNWMPGGRRRDAIYYSILRAEWPAVKEALLAAGKVPPVA